MTSSTKIAGVETFVVELPQKYPIAPYRSHYLSSSSTVKILVRLESASGHCGWGEAPQSLLGAPYSGGETDELKEKLIGRDAADIEALYLDWNIGGAKPVAGDDPHIAGLHLQSATEMAMWDLLGRACNVPLYQLWGGLYRDRIELAACMGIRPPDQAGEIARLYVEMGYSTLKTKAGRDAQEDLEFVRAIRDAVGDKLKLRIDPNTAYSPDECQQLSKDLEPYELEYFEQPMGTDLLEESARIRKTTSTPLALNESVTQLDVVRKILDLDAAAVLLPDTYQCGGLRACRQIADVAASAGVPCVMHCAHDLGVKTAAMLHLVAATANFPLANDCTYYGLVDDVLARPLQIDAGYLPVPKQPGLGVEVDQDKVRKYQRTAPYSPPTD